MQRRPTLILGLLLIATALLAMAVVLHISPLKTGGKDPPKSATGEEFREAFEGLELLKKRIGDWEKEIKDQK